MDKYDFGIFGVWSGCNYGSIATYYALHEVIRSMDKSVLMIDKPIISAKDIERGKTHSRRFAEEHYEISKQYRLDEFEQLNDLCGGFIIGSDQVWNYGISKNFANHFYLDFAADDKKKIAYSVSFGHGIDFAPPEKKAEIAGFMSRFDGISVREADGVRLCRDEYGIKAVQMLDPVFLVDRKCYDQLIEKSYRYEETPFLATYILDPTPEKREAIQHIAKKLGGIKIINLLDGLPWTFARNKELMNLPNCIEDVEIEDWLYYLSKAEFIITDSCHGASFAMIFKKNFIPITNKRRGFSRFKSLAQNFGIEGRLVTDPKRILTDESLMEPLDYNKISGIIASKRRVSLDWLKEKVLSPKKPIEEVKKSNIIGKPNTAPHPPKKAEVKVAASEPAKNVNNAPVPEPVLSNDFKRCKMLVTLVRDYGIKHVVLSAGSRNLNLVRLFEGNDCFKTYSVIDERSAGFYAMGIALKLNEPVAICCTSGTAASNYLTSVTEAFYQHVPILVITADRYPALLGQNEDQTIPQIGMFEKVCKKSVNLPVNFDSLGDWEARRKICEAILSLEHHVKGPAHINIPIASIERKTPDPGALVLNQRFRKIERVSYEDTDEVWQLRIKRLAAMKKVLIVYGQEHPLTDKEIECIEAFAQKFHAVIAVDHLSNLKCKNSVMSLNILRAIDQNEFDRVFAPDIVITVGGRRMLNDPIIPKLRGQRPPLGHWIVAPDGEVADNTRRLSRIFECSPMYFFKRFTENDIVVSSDDSYLDLWKEAEKKYAFPETTSYSQLYVVENTVRNIPSGSCVHYGIGNTIMMANRFSKKDNVEVFCNMGTNGIDGSASTFMGHAAVSDKLCFLIISDLSFFYDMNSVWSKELKGNIRIMMCNNKGTDLLRHLNSPSITHEHNTAARSWVESLGFTYLSADNKEDFDKELKRFISDEDKPMFFEAFTRGK